jgi:Response regulators consisting of a CheY-like receiver domain and a winged-helix DNA-binding domain
VARSLSILLVEDDPNDVLLVRRAFQQTRSGIPLFVMRNGLEAINYLSGEGTYADRQAYPLPDIVLLDLSMPLMDGIEVLQWIRSQPGLKRLPVIVLTTSMNESDSKKAYEAGANSYVVKPGSFNELVEAIRSLGDFWLGGTQLPTINPG